MLDRPPQLTAASRFFLKLIDTTAHWSRRRAWTVSLLCLGCVSVLEAFTPVAASTALLYMLATTCAVWCLGQRGGLMLGFAAVLMGSVVKHYTAPQSLVSTFGLPTVIWNTVARCAMVAVLSIVVNGLRSALALERWRASSDGLTGVLNKVAFEERLGQQIEQARTQGRALVLAYMDLDGFKGVNDRHGHSAGDGVLRIFATAATQAIRRTDLFARIGGDEFAALLSVRSCEEGDQVAAMLHQRLTAILRQTGFDVTCSMGALVADAASLSAAGGSIELADALMYEVKRSGKNALRIARHSAIGRSLRSAYPPLDEGGLAELLARIDAADRACTLSRDRRHAA